LSGLPVGNWTIVSNPVTQAYTGKTPTKLISKLKANTSYTFVVTDSNGCVSTSSLPAVINPYYGIPNDLVVTSPQTFCMESKDKVSSLSPSGNGIKWYKDASTSLPYDGSELLVDKQIYYVTQTVNNCESKRVSVLVNLDKGPDLTAFPPFNFCSSTKPTVGLLAQKLGVSTGTLSIYEGLTGGTVLSSKELLTTKSYYYNVTKSGCNNSNRMQIDVVLNDGTLPTLSTTTPTLCVSKTLTFGELSKEVGAATGLKWYNSKLDSIGHLPSDKISFPPAKQTFYASYKPVGANTCESKDRIMVNVTLLDVPNSVSLKSNFYEPCKDAKETVANIPTTPYAANSIAWFVNPTSVAPLKTTDPLFTTTYYAAAFTTDQLSGKTCYATERFAVDVHLYDVAFIAHPENTICEQSTGILTIDEKNNQGYPPYTYTIKDVNGNVVGTSAITNKLKEGVYTIEVVDAKKCKQTISETVGCTIKDIPHIITPDGDGKNDTWIIRYHDKYPHVQVTIFNRWGSKVYTSEIPYMDNWDGKPSSDILTLGSGYLPSGTYFYMIDKGNGEAIESGYVELVK
jgi:gliding motility-associated-like protein